MSQIQVNTSDLRSCSQDLNNSANELGNIQSRINNATASMGNAYDGQLKRAVDGITGGSYSTNAHLKNRSFDLGNELIIRAGGFENANTANSSAMTNLYHQQSDRISGSSIYDQSGFLKQSVVYGASLIFGLAGWAGTFMNRVSSSSWFKSGIDVRGVIDDVSDAGLLERMTYESYKNIGRAWNSFRGTRTGMVGKMDRLGHSLQSSNAQKIFKGVGYAAQAFSFGVGVKEDLEHGDNLSRALGSEAIEFAVDKGLFFIPIVGELYLGYKIGVASLEFSEVILEAVGQHENAKWLDETLNSFDFTDQIGDAVYDFVTNPPANIIPNLQHEVLSQFGF